MKVSEKIWGDKEQLIKEGPITIVFFGDSITHGAFELGKLDYESVYWNLLRKRMQEVRNYIPINIINAGIGGTTAKDSLDRLDTQVLIHNPDLIVVCFGLNDVNHPLDEFLSALHTIFEKCGEKDVIFMTPNMLNTCVAEDVKPELREYAKITANYQNSGKFDLYISSAVELAEKMHIPVCNCYESWKELSKNTDITMLLANRINHPIKEMHKLFSDSLFEMIFGDSMIRECEIESTMYNE